jgi:hypothetical protein
MFWGIFKPYEKGLRLPEASLEGSFKPYEKKKYLIKTGKRKTQSGIDLFNS